MEIKEYVDARIGAVQDYQRRWFQKLHEQLDVLLLDRFGPALLDWLLNEEGEEVEGRPSTQWDRFATKLQQLAYAEGLWLHDRKQLAKHLEKGSEVHPFWTERRGAGWRVWADVVPEEQEEGT